MEDGVEVRRASELRKLPTFEKYADSLPAYTSGDVLQAEKEWFEDTVNKFKWLDKAKKELLIDSDYQSIGTKKFIKKSGAKKLASAFHISTSILERIESSRDWKDTPETITTMAAGGRNIAVRTTGIGTEIIITVRARAVKKVLIRDSLSGKTFEVEMESCEALASCSNYELAQKKAQNYNYHNILTTAETRATNRAILNLLGGDVSAEEVFMDEEK